MRGLGGPPRLCAQGPLPLVLLPQLRVSQPAMGSVPSGGESDGCPTSDMGRVTVSAPFTFTLPPMGMTESELHPSSPHQAKTSRP